jgi:hypothetical protein
MQKPCEEHLLFLIVESRTFCAVRETAHSLNKTLQFEQILTGRAGNWIEAGKLMMRMQIFRGAVEAL